MTDFNIVPSDKAPVHHIHRVHALEDVRNVLRQECMSYAMNDDGDSATFHRITIDIPNLDPLLWLTAQAVRERSYFCNRERTMELAAVGVAAEIRSTGKPGPILQRARALLRGSNAIAIGGFRFDQTGTMTKDWIGFDPGHFMIPRFDLSRYDGRTRLCMNLLPDDRPRMAALLDDIVSLVCVLPRFDVALPAIISRDDIPSQRDWVSQIQQVFSQISSGTVEKTVLARRTILEYFETVNPMAMFRKMHERETHCYGFYVENKDGAFMSVSPERLYRRAGHHIDIEALAGTRPRSTSPSDDERLASELRHSEKDAREHLFVVQHIRELIAGMCEDVQISAEPSVVRFKRVQHLQTLFSGELKRGVDDDALISRLHPTPAVGGFPSQASRELIQSIEGFDRGWYAGPVGILSSDGAEFAVGIRSALVRSKEVHLFAGCGIVAGSDPLREWDEIETKISGFMELFSGE